MLDDGRGFGRSDGLAVFLSGGTVPGDLVSAKITKVKKNSAEAELVDIIEPSPDRISSECPYSAECGGCTMRELSYSAQLGLKERQVTDKLTRIAGLENPVIRPIIGADNLNYYRNKAVFAVGPHGEVGFRHRKSHYVIDVQDCLLQSDPAMVCADALRAFLKDHPEARPQADRNSSGNNRGRKGRGKQQGCQSGTSGITQLTIKTAFGTGEVMAVLDAGSPDIPEIDILVEMFDDAVYSLNQDSENGSDSGDDLAMNAGFAWSLESVAVIANGKCEILAGKPTITDAITIPAAGSTEAAGTYKFEIGPQSFYQVNPEQMAKLYAKAAEYADLTGTETVLDLYCGVGTIGITMAGKSERVIGIESVKPAVIDANRNSVINGIINTRYIAGKAEDELPVLLGQKPKMGYDGENNLVEKKPELLIDHVDVAIVDPPRAGCDETLLGAIVKSAPRRVVYVSCDPGTLARDIRFLTESGYRFAECTPVDQFPWTSHVECVTLLEKTLNE